MPICPKLYNMRFWSLVRKSWWCHTWYLSFFLHEQNFWRIKFTPKKRVNYDKIHSKLPIFCVIRAKYLVNCQFRVKSVKIYTGQKKFTQTCSWGSWQISGMDEEKQNETYCCTHLKGESKHYSGSLNQDLGN